MTADEHHFGCAMKLRLVFATLLAFICANAYAADAKSRVVEITANDTMKFSLATIEAKAGEEFTVVFTNNGTVAKDLMGHNWVLLKPGTDVNAFGTAAMTAKATDYIPDSMKDKVVAHTAVLGPRQKGEVKLKLEAGEYTFICSFPGHVALMKGVVIVK
jgi:azurin